MNKHEISLKNKVNFESEVGIKGNDILVYIRAIVVVVFTVHGSTFRLHL